jgi:hypothetical protein
MYLADFCKADFHVHTRASQDYYHTQEDEEKDYIGLLRNAKENRMDIIAITDHNTIDGYKKLIEIKGKYDRDYETIKRHNLTGDSIEGLVEIKSLFSDLLILPGLEYDARPGIHLLIIFDAQIGVDEIDTFISKAGITPEMKGNERKGTGKWHVEEVLDQANTLNAIVIGAHADRDLGIFGDTKGDYRRQLLTNEHLHGLEFKNSFNREQIKVVLRDPLYSRKYDIALLQNSDFHNKVNQNIGDPCTFIRLADKTFSQIKESFLSPLSNITSPEEPDVEFVLQKLERDERTYFLETYSDEERLIKAAIGLANAGSGNILIGESPERKRLGLDEADIDNAKKTVKNSVQLNVEPIPNLDFITLNIGKKSILYVEVRGRSLALYSNKQSSDVFLWKDGKPRLADKSSVMGLLKEINKREINKLLSPKIKRIENLSLQMKKLRDDLEGMYITYKYDKSPLTLGEIIDWSVLGDDIVRDSIQKITKFKKELEDINKDYLNGTYKGNTVYLNADFRPRYEEYVLRYSAPKYNFKDHIASLLPKFPDTGDKIILVNGGGTFLSTNEERIYYPDMIYDNVKRNMVFLHVRSEYSSCYTLKYLLAYLKSVALLWFSYSIYDSVNLFKPNLLTKLPAPPECEKLTDVEKLIDEILELEALHLKAEEELKFVMSKSGKDIDQTQKRMIKRIEQHNEMVNDKQLTLDKTFFRLFSIDEEEIRLMCRMLKERKIQVNDKLYISHQ